jgi:hypothetical protein
MKKLYILSFMILALFSCQDSYDFNSNFTAPETLNAPKSIQLDVTSTVPVVLTWEGGGAADGGIVLYNVLFDKADGDFSNPIDTIMSDQGALPQLSILQATINTLARKAGIHPNETGTLKWTVIASKGGIVKKASEVASISVTRGEGIDNLPKELYLYGTATENSGAGGQQFRQMEDGVFRIYSKLSAGNVFFKSGTGADAFTYFINDASKLSEGTGTVAIAASDDLYRLTVNFNTLKMTVDKVGTSVRAIWGCTFNNIAVLNYAGNGKFVGNGTIRFVQQSRPDTNPPGWLSWVEERYYFIAKVNGNDTCWGRGDNVSGERPTGGEAASFYELHEFSWSQWEHLWKMKGTLDNTTATITIDTNSNGMMIHTFTNVAAIN